jgi:hypothetical protein
MPPLGSLAFFAFKFFWKPPSLPLPLAHPSKEDEDEEEEGKQILP